MPKLPNELTVRVMTSEEIGQKNGRGARAMIVEWLASQFWPPVIDDNGQPVVENGEVKCREIQVGEGIEIAGFDSRNEALNWSKYYLPQAVAELGWGKETNKAGKRKPVITSDVEERDNQFYLQLVRIRE